MAGDGDEENEGRQDTVLSWSQRKYQRRLRET